MQWALNLAKKTKWSQSESNLYGLGDAGLVATCRVQETIVTGKTGYLPGVRCGARA
jgi:hypothetical protein